MKYKQKKVKIAAINKDGKHDIYLGDSIIGAVYDRIDDYWISLNNKYLGCHSLDECEAVISNWLHEQIIKYCEVVNETN